MNILLKAIKNCTVLIILSMLSIGCTVQPPVKPNDPYYAPVMKTNSVYDKPINGSLFTSTSSMVLFTDQKAKRVGDIITVVLQERTASSKTSNVGVTKDSDTSLATTDANGTILGTTPNLAGKFGLNTNLSANREFTGEADADQSNQLSGQITVTVVDVFPNGNLVIRGEKWITLNRGDEFIRISGIVRSEDITPSNTVQSNKIADARITYSGSGELADSQEMGWLTRFFNSPVWPF